MPWEQPGITGRRNRAGLSRFACLNAFMDLKHADNPMDAAGPVKAMLSNLFNGWGYNFYRKENRLRADDLLIRTKAGEFLGEARTHLARLEMEFRREHLPSPTREHPFPDRSSVLAAQALERIQKSIEAMEVKVRNASVPEMDRIHQPHLNERDTLEKLAMIDQDLVGAVFSFREGILKLTDGTTAVSETQRLLAAIQFEAVWDRRSAVLSILA